MNQSEINETSPQKSILDVTTLPEEQRQLVNWITHQQKVSLSQTAHHFNLAEELILQHLENLIFQGFIQEVNENNSTYYQPLFTTQKKSKLSQNIWDKL